MRLVIKILRNKYLLEQIDTDYVDGLFAQNKITLIEKTFILTGE